MANQLKKTLSSKPSAIPAATGILDPKITWWRKLH